MQDVQFEHSGRATMETQPEASAGAAQADRRQLVPPAPGATAFKRGRPVTLLHQTGQGKTQLHRYMPAARLPPSRSSRSSSVGETATPVTERSWRAQLQNRAFLVRDQSAKDHFWVRDRERQVRDRSPRSRQRTATIGVFGFATVYLVRHALAGIERATCWTDRLAVRTASCGSRRERFAARRVGEHVSSDVSLCTSYQS